MTNIDDVKSLWYNCHAVVISVCDETWMRIKTLTLFVTLFACPLDIKQVMAA